MAVVKKYFSDQKVYSIDRDDMSTKEGLSKAFDDLDAALDDLFNDLDSEAYDFFSFEFLNKGVYFVPEGDAVPSEEFDREYQAVSEYLNPWNFSVQNFCVKVAEQPSLHSKMMEWLKRIENKLKSEELYGGSAWQDDETQLGEPFVSTLALIHRKFVPCYTGLMTYWDMDHEVRQHEVIGHIFKKHGVCPETEDLLYCRMITNHGQWGVDLLENVFPMFQTHYGDFCATPLFRQIVIEHDPWDWGDISPLRRSNHAAIREATATIVAELSDLKDLYIIVPKDISAKQLSVVKKLTEHKKPVMELKNRLVPGEQMLLNREVSLENQKMATKELSKINIDFEFRDKPLP